MKRLAFLLWWIYSVSLFPACSSQPGFTCPQYVEEGSSLSCLCTAPSDSGPSTPVFTWPGHSLTSQLVVTNVTRVLNGTQYTCQMTVGGVSTTTVYTLQVAYGPADENLSITGPSLFPTDGSKTLNLTCLAHEVNPAPSYTWSGVTCDNGNLGNTCSFRPQPEEDGKRVACVASASFVGMSVKSASRVFMLHLQYPPATAPVVTSVDAPNFLRSGDVITCTVTGGKPAVSNVTFKCTDPQLPDEDDVVQFDDATGVTSLISSVTVLTSEADSSEIFCLCFATWQPDAMLYASITQQLLPIEYKASVTNFTLNGKMTSLTVRETDVTRVDLACSASGRPSPNMTLSKMGAEGVISQQTDLLRLTRTLSDVTCPMAGVYVCTVSNGLSRPDQQVVMLAVLCGPRHVNASASSLNSRSPPTLTAQGLSFIVIANPAPDSFTYTLFHNATSSGTTVTTQDTGSAVSSLFTTACTKAPDSDHLATCALQAVRVSTEELGVYSVTVSNSLGSYQFYFQVKAEITTPAAALPSSDADDDVPIAAIVGGVFGGILVIAVIVVFVVVKRKRLERKMGPEQTPRPRTRHQNGDDFEEHINVAYVSADTLDSGPSSNRHMPKNHSSASHLYEDVNDNVKPDLGGPDSDGNYASVSELNPPLDPQKRKASRVSFKLDIDQDTYASVDDAGVVENPAKSPRAESSAYAVVSVDGRVSSRDHEAAKTVSGENTESDRTATMEESSGTLRPEVRSDAEISGMIRGPLGDIYSQVRKSPTIRKANLAEAGARGSSPDCGGDTDSAHTQNGPVDTAHSSGPAGDVYAEVSKIPKGVRVGDEKIKDNDSDLVQQADAACPRLPDRTDVQKPARKLKPLPLFTIGSNPSPDIYDEASSIQSKPSFKCTEL